ncbi:hypothetical protein [Helicobacter sp. 11S03491-1]|uniref:hypothetical protein n=1 Tax=Helicobacter sp. 11S03491-1 TaxID=1476196 RepID=UPI000BA5D520|nr:hypothetical protein [Helicobacter sp. 11S03491-1]PAF43017.1 hypothetical protein BKH45_02800 [Helicobacter sp. 11S03491-1]
MSEIQNPQDIWEKKLEEKIQILKDCQNQKNIQSCFKCEKIIECKTRKDYVKSVYESMNKGVQDGDFEF